MKVVKKITPEYLRSQNKFLEAEELEAQQELEGAHAKTERAPKKKTNGISELYEIATWFHHYDSSAKALIAKRMGYPAPDLDYSPDFLYGRLLDKFDNSNALKGIDRDEKILLLKMCVLRFWVTGGEYKTGYWTHESVENKRMQWDWFSEWYNDLMEEALMIRRGHKKKGVEPKYEFPEF